jgi:dCMP deaminase
MRIGIDEYFLNISETVAQRATCLRRQVGAVIVRDKKILATGFNGSPKGLPHCLDIGCLVIDSHCARCLHAEENAILQAAQSLEAATIYCTDKPCLACTRRIINVGISKVIYLRDYPDPVADSFMKEAGIEIFQYVKT